MSSLESFQLVAYTEIKLNTSQLKTSAVNLHLVISYRVTLYNQFLKVLSYFVLLLKFDCHALDLPIEDCDGHDTCVTKKLNYWWYGEIYLLLELQIKNKQSKKNYDGIFLKY